MNALEFRDVSKSYKGFALSHLDLALPNGCIMGLIGENGAGKSTALKTLLNIVHKDSGEIYLLGKEQSRYLRELKEDIGVVLDEVGIPDCLTGKQVGKILKNMYRNWDEKAFAGYLKRFSVPDDKAFKALSRGMKMKLGIAAALSHGAKLLILDEATNGLDPVARDELLDIFIEFTREEDHSILISSHIVSDLEKICDYVAFLHKGKLLICEEKDRLEEKYGTIHCTREEFQKLPEQAVLGKKVSSYGIEAIADRAMIPSGMHISPVDIEQLFVFMVKEA